MTSLWPGSSLISSSSSSACAASLWRKTLILARDRRAPSMMLAWFSSSEMMKSSLPRMRRNRSGIRGEARLEDHAGFDVLEARDLLFQLHVELHGAGDGAHRARAHAVLARGFQRRLAQLGMRGQAEIIVGREVDDLLAVEGADRRLLVFEHAQMEVGALLLELVELVGQDTRADWCVWQLA